MKKAIIGCLAILLALSLVMIAACDLGDGIGGGVGYKNNLGVSYAKDGSSLTLYLDSDARSVADSSRALTTAFAKIGLEKFEVVFAAGSQGIARASWELGKPVSIKGVPRGTAGIEYFPAPDDITTAEKGGAILFAGTKNGTLLAVGKIVALNGATPVQTMASATILDSTKSVTFGLSALNANVNSTVSATAPISSFVFDAPAAPADKGVAVVEARTGYPYINGFLLKTGLTGITAKYTITASSTNFDLAAILPNVIVKTPPTNVIPITPRFPLQFGQYWQFPGPYADGFSATINTATAMAANTALSSGVFNITMSSGTIPGVIAFYFEIPVYALINTATSEGVVSEDWYIRTGDDFAYLDAGGGTGSTVFLYVANDLTGITGINYRNNDIGVIVTGP